MHHQIKYPYTVNFCDIGNNIKIAYGDEGNGKDVLLFVHGLANYGPVWYNNITELKNNFRCIVVDLPGNGLSSRGDYPHTMFFYAECLAKFIEKLKLTEVNIVGHSMGGHVSIVLALRYPHLINKLILVAPSGFEHFTPNERLMLKGFLNIGNYLVSDKISLKTAIENSFFNLNKEWVQNVLGDLNGLIDAFGSTQWQKMVFANINAMLDEQVSMFLEHISQPTLVVFGNNDLLIPNKLIHFSLTSKSLAEHASSLIKNCELKLFEDCGHLVQIEKLNLFNAALRDFVLK